MASSVALRRTMSQSSLLTNIFRDGRANELRSKRRHSVSDGTFAADYSNAPAALDFSLLNSALLPSSPLSRPVTDKSDDGSVATNLRNHIQAARPMDSVPSQVNPYQDSGVEHSVPCSHSRTGTSSSKLLEASALLDPKQTTMKLEFTLIDTEQALVGLLDILQDLLSLTPPEPIVYLDVKGRNLGRYGSLSFITMMLSAENRYYIIDASVLRSQGPMICDNSKRTSLKSFLESESMIKAVFDARSASDALYNTYGVRLAGIHELQLMEFASRQPMSRFLNGLVQCISRMTTWSKERQTTWLHQKQEGRQIFNPAYGGDDQVLEDRPLSDEVVFTCIQDVSCLPGLWQEYFPKLSQKQLEKVGSATVDRIRLTQTVDYQGQGKHMRLGPRSCLPSENHESGLTIRRHAGKRSYGDRPNEWPHAGTSRRDSKFAIQLPG